MNHDRVRPAAELIIGAEAHYATAAPDDTAVTMFVDGKALSSLCACREGGGRSLTAAQRLATFRQLRRPASLFREHRRLRLCRHAPRLGLQQPLGHAVQHPRVGLVIAIPRRHGRRRPRPARHRPRGVHRRLHAPQDGPYPHPRRGDLPRLRRPRDVVLAGVGVPGRDRMRLYAVSMSSRAGRPSSSRPWAYPPQTV